MTHRGALTALLAALLAASTVAAQGRTRRHRPPPRSPAGPVELRLLRVERASAVEARLALPTVLPAVTRCLDHARALDPGPLSTLRRVDVVLRLSLAGRASAVELDPPVLARGLSACLGDAFLTWRQSRVSHPRASVHLGLVLRPP
ncbi:MAG: hypothetical protein Q8S73_45650 [Deltaproteobacteria bacterium]|nr:hypothetical protein [Myxococcales bacterium]MDP3221456.1 hypothetical protein [Deltaproteobacteria bacterium]